MVGQHVGHVGALGADLSALEDHRPRGQECGLRRGDPEGGVSARVEGVELDETPAARAVPGAVVLGAVARAALRLPVVGTARDGDIPVIAQLEAEVGDAGLALDGVLDSVDAGGDLPRLRCDCIGRAAVSERRVRLDVGGGVLPLSSHHQQQQGRSRHQEEVVCVHGGVGRMD